MKTKIYVPDIECDSCIKVLQRRFSHLQGIESTTFHKDSIDVVHNDSLIKPQNIITAIQDAGYRAALQPFARKTVRERSRDFIENRQKYTAEWNALKYSVMTLIILLTLHVLVYLLVWKNTDFLIRYGWWILYLDIAVASLGAALWHLGSYRGEVTSMTGMMIGMTMGMQTGMMVGAVFGATNGLFVGSVVGVLLAVPTGILTGKCCGIMGMMQGMMAGLMGGVMGPMVTLMLFSDHLLWFMPLYTIINVIILWGFSYMLYEEVVEDKQPMRHKVPFTTLALSSIVLTAILTLIIIYAPKSPLVGGI